MVRIAAPRGCDICKKRLATRYAPEQGMWVCKAETVDGPIAPVPVSARDDDEASGPPAIDWAPEHADGKVWVWVPSAKDPHWELRGKPQ